MDSVFISITDYLLNQSWQIAILFAVVVIVCMAIRKKTAHLRYLLWLLIIAKCLVPSLITVSLAILPQKPLLQPLPESAPIREFAPPPETVIMSPGAPLSPPAPLPVRRPSIMAQLAQIPPKTWLSGIWLGGVGLFLLIVVIKAARFNRRLSRQRKRLTAGMQKEIDELLDRFGVHAKLHIWLLDGIGQPFVWGLLRGSIYLPANFSQIGSREHRRGILMHEITHVARFDAAVNCLQAIAQAVFWFHPLVWWANRNIRAEREKCCDETAIARLSAAPKVYSSAIVDTLIAEYQSTLPVPSLAIAGPIKNIEDRIKTIMKPGKKFYNRPTIIAIVTILLLAIAAVPTTIALTHRQAKKPEEYLTKTDVQVEAEEAVDVEILTVIIKAEDEEGGPVAGAVITPDGLRTKKEKGSSHYIWRKDRYGEPVTVKTNAQGKAKVAYPRYANEKLETGSVSFLINHPDFCTDRPFYNIDETDKPVVLKRGATLRVSGYLESKGDLLTGIYPQLGRGRLYSDSWQQSQEGVYETHQLPPGPHYIRLVYLPEDGPASFSEAVRFDAEKGETYEFNLQLKPGVRLVGTLDETVPRPVRNGRVVAAAHPLNHPHHSKRPRKRFTDPSVDPGYLHWRSWREVEKDGTFVFESLPHGEVELIAICDGYISKNPPDEENMNIGIAQSWPLKEPVTGAKLKMKPTASCKIKVLDEHGKPVKGAQVGFSPNVQWHSGGAQIFATPLNTFDLLRAGGKLSPDKWLKISEVADFQAISDESGIAVVPNMPDGKRHFAVLHPQYQLPAKTGYAQFPRRVAEVELIAGQTAEVTVTMQKKGDDFLGAEDLDTRTSYKADIEITKPVIQTCRPKYNPNAEDMQVLKGQKAGPSEISGIVIDQKGQPIEGVLVDVWTWYPGNETHTDKNGFFALKDFEPDQKTVEIRFSKDKCSPRYILRQPLGLKETRVVLGDKTYFEGNVFDSDSKPVPNALIKAIAGPKDAEGVLIGEIPTTTTSGDDGSYRLYVQADTYDIQVKADKGVVRLPKVDIAKNEAKQLDFKLESSVTFKAKIVDSQTGKPVEGIRLFHWKHEDVDGTSNSDGLIEIIGMLPGKFEFWVEAEQCGRWWSQQCISKWNRRHIDDEETGWQRNFDGLDFDLSVGMEPVTIVTEKPVKINGKIVDPLGNPVAGATATLAKTGSGNSITGDTRYSFATDKNGKFEMIVPASKEAEYNLLAHDGEYDEWRKWANGVLQPIKTNPSDMINDIVIELGEPASVKGKVLDSSGNPVPNNKVRSHAFDKLGNRYYDPTTRTGKNGDFEIKFIRAGKHYIQAYPFWLTAEQAPGKTSNIVTLQPGQNLEGIELITNQPEKLSPLKVQDLKNPDVQVEILTDKPPVVLDLDSGKTLTLEKDWPDEYDVGWDNDGGGGLFSNRAGTTKMLPISTAKDFADAVSIAFSLQESLNVHGIRGVLAEDSKYIAVKTSQGNIAVLEIIEYSQSKAKVKWKIIDHVKKPDVQVEGGRSQPNSFLESEVNDPADKYNQILEPLNRQRQELEKELKALRDAYDDTEHLTGVRLTVSNAELETAGWFRKRYVASGVVRCEMPNQLLMQTETAIWPDSFEVHTARTAAYLKDRDLLQEVIRRDKVRRTKWFQARKKDTEKAIDSLAESLAVQVKDTADIEVKFTAADPGDARTILDELLQLFILRKTDQAQNELTKKMADLHEEKRKLKRSIQFLEDEKQTLQKDSRETQKPDVQVEAF